MVKILCAIASSLDRGHVVSSLTTWAFCQGNSDIVFLWSTKHREKGVKVRAKHMALIILTVQQYSRKRNEIGEAVAEVATQSYILYSARYLRCHIWWLLNSKRAGIQSQVNDLILYEISLWKFCTFKTHQSYYFAVLISAVATFNFLKCQNMFGLCEAEQSFCTVSRWKYKCNTIFIF